jgi:hypothetical protein
MENILDIDNPLCGSKSEEEPCLFAPMGPNNDTFVNEQEDVPECQDKTPHYTEDAPNTENSGPIKLESCISDSERKERSRCSSKFVLKCEEIRLPTFKQDDEASTGSMSDITEDFLQIPASSPLFKKAMQMFREMAAEENRLRGEHEDDDVKDLNHVVSLAI